MLPGNTDQDRKAVAHAHVSTETRDTLNTIPLVSASDMTVKTRIAEVRTSTLIGLLASQPDFAGVFGAAYKTTGFSLIICTDDCARALKEQLRTVQAVCTLSHTGDEPDPTILKALELIAPGLSLRMTE